MPLTWLHILPPATQNMVRLPRSMADSRHQAERDRTFFESDKLTLVIYLHMLAFCYLPASYRIDLFERRGS